MARRARSLGELEVRGGFLTASIQSWATSQRLAIGGGFLIFLLAFLVYHFTSQGGTDFNNPVRLADTLLRGRLDIPNGENLGWMDWAIYNGKYYMVDPPMTAIILLPGVLLFGPTLNQALVSAVVGGITASSVFFLMRGLTKQVSLQIWLTLLFAFGTIYWWAVANGAVWHFSHAVAVLFLVLAIYETLVARRPLLAGLFLGAAYWSRLPTLMALPFFIIMFTDHWPLIGDWKSLLRKTDFKPLLHFGLGLGIFLVLSFIYNYLRFETPLPAAQHHWLSNTSVPASYFDKGLFDVSYIPRHASVVFTKVNIFRSVEPYIFPSWVGMAIWATTPAFLYALFAGVRNKTVITLGSAALVITMAVLILSAVGSGWGVGWLQVSMPLGLEYYPFLLLVGYAVFAAARSGNRLVLACWSAIIPIALVHFTFGSMPPQFGYRYALDYSPFLLLLTLIAIGDKLKWHHMTLIGLALLINFWGVLWIHQFEPRGFLGLHWVRF